MPTLSADHPLPLYAQLADVLRQRIERGQWREGDRLPSLEELTREFAVARVTVRQAVGLLETDGLVASRQGRGTFVIVPPGAHHRMHVQTTLESLVTMLQGDEPRLLNIEEGSAMPPLTVRDGTAAAEYVTMRRVHLRDETPYCVISIYLEAGIFRQAPERFRTELMIPTLTSLPSVVIAGARQTLTIGLADAELAGHLRVAVNAPIAHVRRVFRAPDGTVFYLGEVSYRGDLLELEMDLAP